MARRGSGDNGPSFTKPTYKASKGFTRRSPEQEKAQQEQDQRDEAKRRNSRKQIKAVGVAKALSIRVPDPKKP